METKQDSIDRHELIREFREVLTGLNKHPLCLETEGVVVLSAPEERDQGGNVVREDTPENRARIAFGLEVIRRIAAIRKGKSIEEVKFEEGPPLILDGDTIQLPVMESIASVLGYPKEKIISIDCGARGVGNTKTQFKLLEYDSRFKDSRHLTFITSIYHVPRVERTASRQLDTGFHYDVVPMPWALTNTFKMVLGEARRILRYSEKGDIAKVPRKKP